MEEQTTSFDEIIGERKIPAIAANRQGIIFFVNTPFEQEYGWQRKDLEGFTLTRIVPAYMRDAHNLGFSRFLTTETRRILDREIPLPVLCKDGTIREAMHFITAKRIENKWQFAALINPV